MKYYRLKGRGFMHVNSRKKAHAAQVFLPSSQYLAMSEDGFRVCRW